MGVDTGAADGGGGESIFLTVGVGVLEIGASSIIQSIAFALLYVLDAALGFFDFGKKFSSSSIKSTAGMGLFPTEIATIVPLEVDAEVSALTTAVVACKFVFKFSSISFDFGVSSCFEGVPSTLTGSNPDFSLVIPASGTGEEEISDGTGLASK